jgi:hypothetical protein
MHRADPGQYAETGDSGAVDIGEHFALSDLPRTRRHLP